jgi:hypothetical protein
MKRRFVTSAAVFVLLALMTACGAADSNPIAVSSSHSPGAANTALVERIDDIEAAVKLWQDASTIADAHAAAEQARNLVVGPNGPDYGDADGNGGIDGNSQIGILPGLSGEVGLAQSPPVNACVTADVLGGAWDDPQARWGEALTAVDDWSTSNNTFPSLASHLQRVYGWASLTLATQDLAEAHEYSSHAQLHVDVTRTAVEDCP